MRAMSQIKFKISTSQHHAHHFTIVRRQQQNEGVKRGETKCNQKLQVKYLLLRNNAIANDFFSIYI